VLVGPPRFSNRSTKMTTTTNTTIQLERPYWGAGIIAVILSFGVLAFSLGVLDRCGGGSGICVSPSTHASGDAGLIIFIVLFIIGVALIATTGTGEIRTRVTTRDPPSPTVTNVFPPAAAPTPAVTKVYVQPAAEPAPTLIVVPPS
jgi:hypothetical protein